MTDISYKIDSDGVAIVTWDLENRSMNVLNAQSVNEYRDIVEKLVKDDKVKGIIIASAKEAFIAGADLTSNDTFNFYKIGEDKVAMDFNHQLAGKELHFTGYIASLREATEEEISHGHVHGPGGHH